MHIGVRYSHLNAEEYLLVHRPELWQEVNDVISEVDAIPYKTRQSREKTMMGRKPYSPSDMNATFRASLEARGWEKRRNTFWVTDDEKLMRRLYGLPEEAQKKAIQESGHIPIMSYNQTDFIKDRVAIEVKFGKYAFVTHDLFVRHLSFTSRILLT